MDANTIVGIEKMCIARQTLDNKMGLTYETPVYYAGVKEMGIKPKSNNSKNYAENQLAQQANVFDAADVDILRNCLTSAEQANLLGQTLASSGGVFAKSDDKPPYVALLYKANIDGGGFRYGVLYKGMFSIPEVTMKGQEGKIEYQNPKLSAVFQPTKNNKMWEYHVDTTDPNCPDNIDTTWFNSVVIPAIDTVPPTLVSVPANNATAVATSAVVVITFNKAMDASTITDGNIFLTTAAGVQVSCALTLDATQTIATLTPKSKLSTGAHLAIVTNDVKSATGVNLEATKIIKFTVA